MGENGNAMFPSCQARVTAAAGNLLFPLPKTTHSPMSQNERPIFDSIGTMRRLESLEMSMAELGRRMGLTRQAVGHWMRGRGEPDVRQLKQMAKELGCHWLELVTDKATVLHKEDEIERTERIRSLSPQELAELDAYLKFKVTQPK